MEGLAEPARDAPDVKAGLPLMLLAADDKRRRLLLPSAPAGGARADRNPEAYPMLLLLPLPADVNELLVVCLLL